jgi:hypothetical protein
MGIYNQSNSLHSSMAESWFSDEKFSFTEAAKKLLHNSFKDKFGGNMKFLLANPALAALSLLPPVAGISGAMISYIHKMGALHDAAQRLLAANDNQNLCDKVA